MSNLQRERERERERGREKEERKLKAPLRSVWAFCLNTYFLIFISLFAREYRCECFLNVELRIL